MIRSILRAFTVFIFIFPGSVHFISAQINPAKEYSDLFKAVQLEEIFQDQKRFADCAAKVAPDSIRKAYSLQKNNPDFNLKNFVGTFFDTIQNDTAAMLQHIHYLWNDLTKQPAHQKEFSSLIALPNQYIVPGGRFREIYYWDSYFTMLGLQEDKRVEMIQNMVDNFKYLILKYDHIPNGNRTYYLSRSQPPFFSLMVQLLAETLNDESIFIRYLPALQKEYNYWMTGKKAVHFEDGNLNRYWDALNSPRPESYKHDVILFEKSQKDSGLYRDIRSAAESGWDFSTRWFTDGINIESIATTNYIPVDLNCLLYNLESTLAKAYKLNQQIAESYKYEDLAKKRKQLIIKYFWNKQKAFFVDYNWKDSLFSPQLTLAGLFPLFFKIATPDQAKLVKQWIETEFLKPGGLVTTLVQGSGQQWDYPNGWAPLQWIAYQGLKNYDFNELANEIATRWLNLNMKVYFETGKMMEKYDVVDLNRKGGGGEYETQDGFGWTNGIFLKFWNLLKH